MGRWWRRLKARLLCARRGHDWERIGHVVVCTENETNGSPTVLYICRTCKAIRHEIERT